MKTILVCGHGTGISDAVARKFGKEGFAVALVARSADKLEAAAAALEKSGVRAKAFPTDLSDPKAVKALVGKVRESLGPITAIHYNAYGGGMSDLLADADLSSLRTSLDVGVFGLVAAVQAALPDLEKQENAAVLVTGGGFANYDPGVDAMTVQFNAMALAISKAAQHKLAGLLSERLKAQNVYVGEVVVLGMVKGTAFDHGNATLEASGIADKFWELYTERKVRSVNYPG